MKIISKQKEVAIIIILKQIEIESLNNFQPKTIFTKCNFTCIQILNFTLIKLGFC